MKEQKVIRKLTVTGKTGSYYLVLPKEMIKSLNWKKGEKKVVSQQSKSIVITDWKP